MNRKFKELQILKPTDQVSKQLIMLVKILRQACITGLNKYRFGIVRTPSSIDSLQNRLSF